MGHKDPSDPAETTSASRQAVPPVPAAAMSTPPATISTLNAFPSARFNLSIGAPSYGPPDALRSVLTEVLSDPTLSSSLYRYNDEHGIPELLTTWANILFSHPETPTNFPPKPLSDLIPDHSLMITPGGNQAFMNILLATCSPGDEVLLPLPYYFSHHTALTTASLTPVLVQPDPVSMLPDPADLRAAVTPRTRALVLSSPANPSGAVFPAKLLNSLSEMCAELSLWFITDEVYRDLAFGHPGRIAPSAPDGPHTARIFSLSKSHGIPGLRVGALMYPNHLHDAMVAVQDTLATHAPTLSQHAAMAVLRAEPWPGLGERGDLVFRTRVAFENALKPMFDRTALRDRFVSGTGGGYYLFLPYWDEERVGRPASPQDDAAAVLMLVEKFDVLVVPGSASGMCGFLRVSCASTAKSDLEQAARALADGVHAVILKNQA